jgi:hypothetical protein
MTDIRTPFEGAPPPRVIAPQAVGRTSSEKILADIKRTRLRSIKRAFVALLLIASAGLVGMQWMSAFAAGTITAGAVAATVIFMAFMPIASVLLQWHVLAVSQILAAFFIVAPFWGKISLAWLALLWLLGATMMILGGISAQMRSGSAVSFNFNVLAGCVGVLALGFSLTLAGLYYGATPPNDKLFISEESMTKMLTAGQGITARILPGFNPNMSIDEYARVLVAGQEERIDAALAQDPRYLALPEPQQRQIRAAALEEIRRETLRHLSEALNRPLNPEQTMVSVVHEYVSSWVAGLLPEARRALFTTWLAILFFVVWSIGMLLKPIIMVVSWIFMQIFLGVRLIEIGRESTERKYLTFT